ncbi:MAG: hypothetical protein RL325_290, partial [Planctomycetota bacterium]
MAILLGHLLTLCAAAMLVGIAFLVRRIPRTGPRRWLMPAWVLVLSLLVLVALLHVYADEAYSLYLTLRGEDFYSIDLATKASPR